MYYSNYTVQPIVGPRNYIIPYYDATEQRLANLGLDLQDFQLRPRMNSSILLVDTNLHPTHSYRNISFTLVLNFETKNCPFVTSLSMLLKHK